MFLTLNSLNAPCFLIEKPVGESVPQEWKWWANAALSRLLGLTQLPIPLEASDLDDTTSAETLRVLIAATSIQEFLDLTQWISSNDETDSSFPGTISVMSNNEKKRFSLIWKRKEVKSGSANRNGILVVKGTELREEHPDSNVTLHRITPPTIDTKHSTEFRQETLLDALPYAVELYDQEGDLLYLNSTFHDIFGLSTTDWNPNEHFGPPFRELVKPECFLKLMSSRAEVFQKQTSVSLKVELLSSSTAYPNRVSIDIQPFFDQKSKKLLGFTSCSRPIPSPQLGTLQANLQTERNETKNLRETIQSLEIETVSLRKQLELNKFQLLELLDKYQDLKPESLPESPFQLHKVPGRRRSFLDVFVNPAFDDEGSPVPPTSLLSPSTPPPGSPRLAKSRKSSMATIFAAMKQRVVGTDGNTNKDIVDASLLLDITCTEIRNAVHEMIHAGNDASVILAACQGLKTVVEQVEALRRLQTTPVDLYSNFKPSDLIHQILDSIPTKTRNAMSTHFCDRLETTPTLLLKGDIRSISHVFLNMIEYFNGGGKLRLEVFTSVSSDYLFYIAVRDRISGTSTKENNELEASLKLGNVKKLYEVYGRSGVGLYLAKRLAEQMGGHFDIKHDAGTCIVAAIPCEQGQAPNEATPEVMDSAKIFLSTENIIKPKFLVVDECAQSQNILVSILKSEGYGVKIAVTAAEALKILQSGQFDAVFASSNSSTNTDLTQQCSVPVVVISSDSQMGRVEEIAESGAQAVLLKPFRHHEVKQVLAELKSRTLDIKKEAYMRSLLTTLESSNSTDIPTTSSRRDLKAALMTFL
ncbi:hypothetical protein BCR33DRAFT_852657 [Rhizoclosmatium globosum]|uniref:Response regulatory domain-containing protein n=1 Tax=Rhizoclosmatium globosum TaxID=329046 RepID=A0A1Y2C194_9FUNG|nr:hypothetical protein BCR33DRAFT_852657 [Rhizoclosmatium globosum]|eukprot:ORY40789.1 hypothetical protein BCR33DRAFT_852657 [Rhizoclosmatium globosum]